MKVMIDIMSNQLEALRFAINKIETIDPEHSNELRLLYGSLLSATDSWGNPSAHTIFGYNGAGSIDQKLTRQLIFEPNVKMSLNSPGSYVAFPNTPSVMHNFGIGNDHTGYLIMTEAAAKALVELDENGDFKNPISND